MITLDFIRTSTYLKKYPEKLTRQNFSSHRLQQLPNLIIKLFLYSLNLPASHRPKKILFIRYIYIIEKIQFQACAYRKLTESNASVKNMKQLIGRASLT